jgi:hypothetical protein
MKKYTYQINVLIALILILFTILIVGTATGKATTLEEARLSANTSVTEASTAIFPNIVEREQELDKLVVLTFSNTFGKAVATTPGVEGKEGKEGKTGATGPAGPEGKESEVTKAKIVTLESKVEKLEKEVKEQGVLIKAIEKLI